MAHYNAGATSESLIDVLDRVLDKGIVIESWPSETGASPIQPLRTKIASAAVHIGAGVSIKESDFDAERFPYWRRDLWTK